MKRTNILRWVRRTWAQGTVGKTVATVLLVAMVMPSFAGVSWRTALRGGCK